jgi:hypothetical protein
MIRCYHCGTDNLDGSEYCDECGTKLAAAAPPARTAYAQPPTLTTQSAPSPGPSAPPPPSFTREAVTPKPATPYTPPPPPVHLSTPPPAPASNQPPPSAITSVAPYPTQTSINNGPTDNLTANNFNSARSGLNSGANSSNSGPQHMGSDQPLNNNAAASRARLVIQRGGQVGKEFPLVGAEAMIGRWDADGGIFPDVDLDQDDPEAKVSRRHARIHCQNSQYLIEDLGSTNGTFINRGPRLLPGNKQPLHHGDEIIVGKTFLKFVLS